MLHADPDLLLKPAQVFRIARTFAFGAAAVLIVTAALIYSGLQLVGIRFYEVQSDSMVPVFAKGDVIAVRSKAAHNVQVGDVILFQQAGFSQPTAHRVVRVQASPDVRSVIVDKDGQVLKESTRFAERSFWTRGDANPEEDSGVVSESQLLGKELFVVPWPLNLFAAKLDRQALFLLGVLALSAYVLWELGEGFGAWRRRNIESGESNPTVQGGSAAR